MPGIGKTTLAYRLYSDKLVVPHFDIRAQTCVSQVYSYKDLLLAILRGVTGEDSDRREKRADELADELRRTLFSKRYLVLVDDVWESSVWDDLRPCFHDANNGSRIILTTRYLEVANCATSISGPVHLRMLNDDESWKLLEDRVFGKESCSPPLEKVGQQIAKKCGGLPLSIVLVAGILAKMEKKEESWKQVATTLGSRIHNDSKAIIEQSYQDLPCHLKPCFLYFGAFLEDRVIDASMLTRLWISEAFIQNCEGKSLEDVAEGYLENLIGRNLVMVAHRADVDGKVEACRLHDVLLEFCKIRVEEENFLQWIERDQNVNPYSLKQYAQSRLAFCGVVDLEEWSSPCSLVGSLFYRNEETLLASHFLHNFKFLKVLDLGDTVIDCFPTELVYLRFFSARYLEESIPSSIANLWNLETLILKGSGGNLSVPTTVWKMVNLRHVHIFKECFTMENTEESLEDSSELHDLKTLSTPCFSCLEDAEFVLRKTPNLLELICRFKGISKGQLSAFDFPTQLETLHIFPTLTEAQRGYPICISASNLKKLTVGQFRLGIENLSNIAQLQNLQVLELLSINFDDKRWEVSNDEFSQLKVLTLSNCYFEEWIVADDAFPNLQRLYLFKCQLLEEIPSCFGDNCSLQSIQVHYCNESVEKSARDIQETQVEDYQNSGFELSITEWEYFSGEFRKSWRKGWLLEAGK